MNEFWLPILQKVISRFTKHVGGHKSLGGIGLLVLVFIAGCASDTEKWQVVLKPAASLNQGDQGESLPVIVRVYQLRAKDKFQRATFNSLWKNDKEALEGDVLERKEVTVHPETETRLDIDLDLKHGAVFIGVMALFRKPGVEGWKQVVAANSSALNPFTPKVRLILAGYTIKLED